MRTADPNGLAACRVLVTKDNEFEDRVMVSMLTRLGVVRAAHAPGGAALELIGAPSSKP